MGIDTIQDVPTIGFNRALDFCVWVLEFDGLQAPPFDRHGDGDGSLQALGLDPGTWQVWVAQVAAALGQRVVYQEQLRAHHAELDGRYQPLFRKDAAQANERGSPGRPTLLPARVGLLGRYLRDAWTVGDSLPTVPFPQPAELWPTDSNTLRERLSHLWASYKKREVANRRRYWKAQSVRSYLTTSAFQAFEREIGSLRSSPPIVVAFVNYPGPVVYPIPPSVVLIGTRNWSVDPPTFRDIVTKAASLLLPRNGSPPRGEIEPG